MRAECPGCRRISIFPDDQLVTSKNPLERICPACKAHLTLQLQISRPAPQPAPPEPPAFVELDEDILGEEKPSAVVLKTRILRSLIKLPPMPQIILKAQEIIADPESSLRDLAHVIENDQALVARVLGLANSAYFGLSGTVSTVHQASVLLGQKNLWEMILLSATTSLFSGSLEGYRIGAVAIWRHSLAVAYGAKFLVHQRQPEVENDAFVAGLLHDAGKLILDPFIGKDQEVFDDLVPEGAPISHYVEREVLGIDHAEVMARACRFWRFPETQVLAVRRHHHPPNEMDDLLVKAVFLSNLLAKTAGFDTGANQEPEEIPEASLRVLAVSPEELDALRQQTTEAVLRFEEELKPNPPRPDDHR